MMHKKIVESAKFIKMPASSQNLYFHLLLNADDDGIVEAFPVLNLIRANEDDLRVLVSKQFVQVLNEDLVSFIVDFRIQNTLRADRKVDSIYKDLLLQINPDVELLEMKERSDTIGSRISGPSVDGHWTAQDNISEGFKDMSPPTKELMKLVLENKIAHGGHPVLRWNMDNIYIRHDPAGNIKADKEKSIEKIDGAIATIMALDRAIRCFGQSQDSVYDSRGLLFI